MPNLNEVEIRGYGSGLTEYLSTQSTDGVIKAEVSGERLMLVECTLLETGGINPIQVQVKKKDGSGAVMFDITLGAGQSLHIQFANWRIADAYDGANAGDLYLDITGTGTLSAFWIIKGK